jgi:maltooligosyltrehalose trehalohydrolase
VAGTVLLATDDATGQDGGALTLAPWSAAVVKS